MNKYNSPTFHFSRVTIFQTAEIKFNQSLKLYFVFFLLVSNYITNAQEIFKTKDGDVIVNSTFNGEKFRGESKQLTAYINYETSEIQLSLDPTTLRTRSDTFNVCFKSNDAEKLNECLKKSDIQIATLTGKLNIPLIDTRNYVEYDLKFEAKFQLNGITKPVHVRGALNNVNPGDIICCLLTLEFNFQLRDFGVTPPEGYSDIATVQIFQAALQKENP